MNEAGQSGNAQSKFTRIRVPTLDEIDQSSDDVSSSTFKKFKKMNAEPVVVADVAQCSSTSSLGDSSASIAPDVDSSITTTFPDASNSVTTTISVPSVIPSRGSGFKIIVNSRQKGNPVLRHLRNVPYEYGDVEADYLLGSACCALFLSLKYHRLKCHYIHERLKALGKRYALQLLILLVDVTDCQHELREINRMAIMAGCTLLVASSSEEVARYLELYKQQEHKPPDAVMGKKPVDDFERMLDFLAALPSITRTDAMNLLRIFGSFRRVTEAKQDELALCPGFGFKKAKTLFDVLHAPFAKSKHNTI